MESIKVGIREAKVHLSRYLHIVKNGGEVVLTDRGKPVGRIVPYHQAHLSLSDRVKHLESRGIILPRIGGENPKLFPPIAVPDGIAQKFLQEDRDGASR